MKKGKQEMKHRICEALGVGNLHGLICVLVVECSFSVFATAYQFPSGGGDLADLSKWQVSYPSLTELPGTADTVQLGSSSTFTMSWT